MRLCIDDDKRGYWVGQVDGGFGAVVERIAGPFDSYEAAEAELNEISQADESDEFEENR